MFVSQIDGNLMLNFGKLIDLNLSNNDIQELNVFVGKLKWTLSLVSLYVRV